MFGWTITTGWRSLFFFFHSGWRQLGKAHVGHKWEKGVQCRQRERVLFFFLLFSFHLDEKNLQQKTELNTKSAGKKKTRKHDN